MISSGGYYCSTGVGSYGNHVGVGITEASVVLSYDVSCVQGSSNDTFRRLGYGMLACCSSNCSTTRVLNVRAQNHPVGKIHVKQEGRFCSVPK